MKRLYPIFVIAFTVFFTGLNAQTTDNWRGAYLGSSDGTTNFNGVHVLYTITTCNNNDVLLLRVTNNNNYPVKIGWKDNVLTKDDRKLSRQDVQDSVTIQPHTTIAGDCSGSGNIRLMIKLTDFGILKEDFKEFTPTKFDFVIIH